MDPIKNPFSPGAGTVLPELAGRQDILQKALIALERIKNGRAEKSLLLLGLRGVGKTVTLVEILRLAQDKGYKAALIEAIESRQKKSLRELLVPPLKAGFI